MHPKRFALIVGVLMLAVGIVAFIPSLVGPVDGLPVLRVNDSYGLFLGLFAMNAVNKGVLIVWGLLGIIAATARYTNLPMSINFSRLTFFVTGALAILGLFPETNTLFGYWPIFGYNIVISAIIALTSAWFGWALTSKVPDSGPAVRDFHTPLTTR
jgi:hypothetical protein